MTSDEQLAILKQGVEVWNKWRKEHPDEKIELNYLQFGGDWRGVNLSEASLVSPNFQQANLTHANFTRSDLRVANFRAANLINADFFEAYLLDADFSQANLTETGFIHADLTGAVFTRANLTGAKLERAILHDASLIQADLTGADLSLASLVGTNIDKAIVSRSKVYGINIWDLKGEFAEQKELDIIWDPQPLIRTTQKDLGISPDRQPILTVDNIKVAQFIYLILHNEEIRDVINTLTSKTVLILGRFAPLERKTVLDALRNKLREYDLLPIVFDFDRPTDRDFTETIKTLAGLSYFVIADVTNPKSSPLELQATIPNYQIPFVPIIQEGERPFAMMVDLQKKYNWVLDTLSYDSIETLIEALKPAIIDPAIQKHNELRLIKAREPKIRSANDFIDKS